MPMFSPYRASTPAKAPPLTQATAEQGRLDMEAKMRENALRSGNIIGAAELYNAGMGDRTPIADYLFGAKSAPAAAGPVATAAVNPSVAGATPEMLAGAGGSTATSAAAGLGPAGWATLAGLALLSLG